MHSNNGNREKEVLKVREEAARVQEESASILREVALRLEKAAKELRKEGAFPIASMLDAERDIVEGKANGLTHRTS